MSALLDAFVLVLTLALLAGVCFLFLRVLGWALRVLPASRTRAELTERLWPAVAAGVVLVYLLVAANMILGRVEEGGHVPGLSTLGGVLVLALFVALSWWVLRDTASGIFLRGARTFKEGDFVRIDDVEGHVERLGWRAMVVVTHDGNEAIIPYSRAARASIVRTPEKAQATPHVFTIAVPDHDLLPAIKDTIKRVALLSHWSSIIREPELRLEGEDTLEVTVFALESERGYDIEAAVRAALKRETSKPARTSTRPMGRPPA